MDKESLALIISNFNKSRFEIASKILLDEVFKCDAINVESLSVKEGELTQCFTPWAYCLVMDKQDAIFNTLLLKRIQKYKLSRLYVFCKCNMSAAEIARNSNWFSTELSIQVNFYDQLTIAELLIEANKESDVIEAEDENKNIKKIDTDYLTAALHSFTLGSSEVKYLKGQVYDDAILFKVSSSNYCLKEDLLKDVVDYLKLPLVKLDTLSRRVDSLLSKGALRKEGNEFKLSESMSAEIACRIKAYLYELESMHSAQTDLMRDDFHVDWDLDDSKTVSTLLAFSAIEGKIKLLREARVDVDHPLLKMTKGSCEKIRRFFMGKKNLSYEQAVEALQKLAELASTHPLIIKITRACMYMALEGSNPLSAAKALGANTWKDFQVMLEPTVAIPYICYQLYEITLSKSNEHSVNAVKTAVDHTSGVKIPDVYLNECAGHLLSARKYDELHLDGDEMVYSQNVFVAYYFLLLKSGEIMPRSFMEYLATFSSAIRDEKSDTKQWIRTIMIDLASILIKGNVKQESLPFYQSEDLKEYETRYAIVLKDRDKEKPSHLVKHDSMVLKYINDKFIHSNDHWIVISYDNMLAEVGNDQQYNGWVCNPQTFLDMASITRPLSETQMVSVLHNVASSSDKALQAGAKIMDRIIQYSSANMKQWQFRQEIERFKQEIKRSLSNEEEIDDKELIRRTDKFLVSQGINVNGQESDILIQPVDIN